MQSATYDGAKGQTHGQTHDRYLCFSLGPEEYAIPLLSVKEVIAMPAITPIPEAEKYFLGIMNLRGQVISVVDLRRKLSITPSESSETAIIICDLGSNSIGVVVDAVNSVINPEPDKISDKPELQSQRNTDYIHAVYREKDRLILLLEIFKALSTKDHRTIERATNSQGKESHAA